MKQSRTPWKSTRRKEMGHVTRKPKIAIRNKLGGRLKEKQLVLIIPNVKAQTAATEPKIKKKTCE